MSKRNTSLINALFAASLVVLLALSACGPETLVVGLEPTPTPVHHRYVNDAYGFAFHYPETWSLAEEPQLVTLSRAGLILRIAYGWSTSPDFGPGARRTGMPAGDLIYQDKVVFMGKMIPARVLEYERRDKMVLYGKTSLVKLDDLVFSIWLEDAGGASYADVEIPSGLQAEAKKILESFERIEATGKPPAPTPKPAASEEETTTPGVAKGLVTYVNDGYQLAFVYPEDWELEEIAAGQQVPGGKSPTTLHLTTGTLRLAIQIRGADEATVLGVSGRPAGEVKERGTVKLLGRDVRKQVVVHEGKVKSVFLEGRFEDLELYVQLDGGVDVEMSYESIDISESAQSAFDAIVGSVVRTREVESGQPETLTYESASGGFSFRYPSNWTIEEIPGESVDMDDQVSKLADAVIVRQGRFAIAVQHQRKSDPAQIAWGGSLVPGGLGYAEAVLGERVTLLGEEVHKHIWRYDGGTKAVVVNTTGKHADLVLSITLADTNVKVIQDAEAATIPASAIAVLDQILSSFRET